MSYTAPRVIAIPFAISTLGIWAAIDPRYGTGGAGAVWPAANLAIYVPVCIPVPVVVRKLGIVVATAAGNFDLGIYTSSGTRLISTTSTVMAGASTEQFVDITDTTLGIGLYYLAACCDDGAATVNRVAPAAPIPLSLGVLTEALGSVTLPATATFAANQTLAYIPDLMAMLEATAA